MAAPATEPLHQKEEESIEIVFKDTETVQPWTKQITVRSVVTSAFLSIIFNVIVCKLNLTTGVIPSLNVAAGLLGFAIVKFYTVILSKFGLLKQPFTRQENTVIQTCVVASSGIAFSSGSGTYLLAMSPLVASQLDAGNTPANVKSLHLSWMYGFLFLVSFLGLFSIVTLRKLMILDYKLTYPSGTATAHLINSFHTPKGAQLAKKQVARLFNWFGFSFLFSAFQWFFTGGDNCGFAKFPTFGLKAFSQRMYFDFSTTYVGVGMICPYMVNASMLLGAIVAWGIMWPQIEKKKGIWYSADLAPSSLHGIQGYRVFLSIAMMLGDGLFHAFFMLIVTIISFIKKQKNRRASEDGDETLMDGKQYDEKRRTEYFLKDQIPFKFALAGYISLAILCMIAGPFLFQGRIKWYHILVSYLIAPVLAFCNAYGCGLTDWSLASNYGKFAIIAVGAWVGDKEGGVIAGLVSCGVMMSIVSTASDLMQDFKTGYLTLASPRTMFVSQAIGTLMGVVLSPAVFWYFNKAYALGDLHGQYPAPLAGLYRGIALLGVEGVSSLPKNCVKFAIVCFFFAVAMNLLALVLERYEKKWRLYRFVPKAMCMAIPFYLGGYFTIDMCVGSLILLVWSWKNKEGAKQFGPAVASGLICGESLWSLPAAGLSIIGVNPPLCMKFSKGTTS